MTQLTPDRKDKLEFIAIRLKYAVEAEDIPKVTEIINELDLWEARGLAGSMAWLAFGGK